MAGWRGNSFPGHSAGDCYVPPYISCRHQLLGPRVRAAGTGKGFACIFERIRKRWPGAPEWACGRGPGGNWTGAVNTVSARFNATLRTIAAGTFGQDGPSVVLVSPRRCFIFASSLADGWNS